MHATLAVSFLALGAALWPSGGSAGSLDELRRRGQLRIAVYADNAPFSDGGAGVDVDVAKALADRLGLRAEIMMFKDGESVDDDLRNVVWKGHYLRKEAIADVMMHVPVDPFLAAKNDKVRILAPYFRERLVVARNQNVIPQLVTLEVFTREKIGVQFNTVEDHFLLNAYGGALRAQVVHYGSPHEAAAALRKNEVAAVMGRQSHVEGALAGAAGRYAVAPFSAPGLALSGWDLGVAVKVEETELAAAIDRALAGLREDGTIQRLFAARGLSWNAPASASSPSNAGEGASAPAAATSAAAPLPSGADEEASAAPATSPADFEEEVVVTATRGARPRRTSPAAVTVVPRAEIERSPTKTVDELLRAVPSFGLFRRSSSMAADPSSTGVNLRGVGPSAVSRSLVLVDGIPATDPFGGWVYWRAIPRSGVERIEVVPGGGSSLYGNYALGGVTQILSRPIAPLALDASAEVGPFDTYQLGLRAADRRGPVGAAIEAELLDSRGYPVVAPGVRGPIDGDTPSFNAAVTGRAEASVARDLTVTLRGGYFHQDQNGGTQYTTAGVKRLAYGAGARYGPGGLGSFDLSFFGHVSEFTQSRTRVTGGRASEDRAAWQTVPTDDLGAGLVWTSEQLPLLGRHTLTVGADARWIAGEAQEDLFPPSAALVDTSVVRRDAGGTQWLYGAFAQELWDVSPAVELNLAVRYDRWENEDGHQLERTFGGATSREEFPARSDQQVSPKAGLRVTPLEALTLRAAAYGAFRAPTLNELYRPFQVGPVRTEANSNLGPETLRGAEAGLDVAPVRGLLLRATGFWNVLDGPITNVTIGTNLRQRQNLGEARIRGVEGDAALRFLRVWRAAAAYTFTDSEITDAPGQPQLVGKELPQDARHRASASLAFDDPRLLFASAQVRYLGAQYEDDVNALRMSGAFLVDLAVSRRTTDHLELFLNVENLFDRRYLVGRAGGVDTIGQPRFVHGGMRMRFGG